MHRNNLRSAFSLVESATINTVDQYKAAKYPLIWEAEF